MCPNLPLLKTYKVYPRKINFNYMADRYFVYVYLNPFDELQQALKYTAGGTDYCFAYQPIYIGKGTGAGYRQNQHLNAYINKRERNPYKIQVLKDIEDKMAVAAARGDHTKPWNWKEYQDGYVIILETFETPAELLKFEMELINAIGTQHSGSGQLANKIQNAYKFDQKINPGIL